MLGPETDLISEIVSSQKGLLKSASNSARLWRCDWLKGVEIFAEMLAHFSTIRVSKTWNTLLKWVSGLLQKVDFSKKLEKEHALIAASTNHHSLARPVISQTMPTPQKTANSPARATACPYPDDDSEEGVIHSAPAPRARTTTTRPRQHPVFGIPSPTVWCGEVQIS